MAVLGAALAANAAYDYYWFGTAGDDLWTTAANWSSSPDEYVAVANGYPRSTTFNVHVDTSVAPGHHVTIRIPKLASNGASCNAFELFDSTGAGTLTLVGEPDEEAGRPYVPLGLNKTFTWTETGHPMRLEFLNLNLANGTLSVVENECAGCGVLVSNCVSTSTSNSYYLKLPGQHGGSMTVIDSEITTQILNNSAAGSDVAGYVLAVTNSTIKISNGASVGGPGTVVDFVGSTIRLGSYAPAFGAGSIAATNDHANMKVAFKDTTIDFNKKFVLVMSAGGTLLFDNVVQGGECRGVELAGLATTELKNTSLRFYDTTGNGYRGISGDLILDNSEWVGTNASQTVALNGPLRVEFRGAAVCGELPRHIRLSSPERRLRLPAREPHGQCCGGADLPVWRGWRLDQRPAREPRAEGGRRDDLPADLRQGLEKQQAGLQPDEPSAHDIAERQVEVPYDG